MVLLKVRETGHTVRSVCSLGLLVGPARLTRMRRHLGRGAGWCGPVAVGPCVTTGPPGCRGSSPRTALVAAWKKYRPPATYFLFHSPLHLLRPPGGVRGRSPSLARMTCVQERAGRELTRTLPGPWLTPS